MARHTRGLNQRRDFASPALFCYEDSAYGRTLPTYPSTTPSLSQIPNFCDVHPRPFPHVRPLFRTQIPIRHGPLDRSPTPVTDLQRPSYKYRPQPPGLGSASAAGVSTVRHSTLNATPEFCHSHRC